MNRAIADKAKDKQTNDSFPPANTVSPNQGNNPFLQVEQDVRDLMVRCGDLSLKLEEQKIGAEKEAKKTLLEFIEVADAFERLLANIDPRIDSVDRQTKIWVSNFRTVYKILTRALKNSGVTPIETLIGEKANPYWHKVVEVVEDPTKENETIVEEIKKGYLWKGKPLRAAEIAAVKNPKR